jgi:hypothetical protein
MRFEFGFHALQEVADIDRSVVADVLGRRVERPSNVLRNPIV